MPYYEAIDRGGISDSRIRDVIAEALDRRGMRRAVLVPPDITRLHSRSGDIAYWIWRRYPRAIGAIMPALGTHRPMTTEQIREMFHDIPIDLFLRHDCRNDSKTLVELSSDKVEAVAPGLPGATWPLQINRRLCDRAIDTIISIGQVAPHEVFGMSNYTKNIFIGTGGAESIDRSHYLSAAGGIEQTMGRIETPARLLVSTAIASLDVPPPILYILTVAHTVNGRSVIAGLFIGGDDRCFRGAATLSRQLNIFVTRSPIDKAVVFLDPRQYTTMWLANKAVYRLRMAMADGGELIIIAPGLERYGESETVDRLIARHGYHSFDEIAAAVSKNPDLRSNLAVAAHLAHGAPEGRFSVVYCSDRISRGAVERVGYRYADLAASVGRYRPDRLREGYNRLDDGETVFYVSNPATGLWMSRDRADEIDSEEASQSGRAI